MLKPQAISIAYCQIFTDGCAQREFLSELVLVEPLVLEPLVFVPEPVVPRSVESEPLVPMVCMSSVVTRENSSLLSLPSLSVSSLRNTSASLLLVIPVALADPVVVVVLVLPEVLVPEDPVPEEPGLLVPEDDCAEALMAAAARSAKARLSLAFMVMDGVVFGLEPSCDGAGFRPSLPAWLCGLALANDQVRKRGTCDDFNVDAVRTGRRTAHGSQCCDCGSPSST